MVIIKYLGRSVKDYLRNYQEVPPSCEEKCPDCKKLLYKHGKYYRTVITGKRAKRIPIYRRYCPDCGKTFSLLPDFLYPYSVLSGHLLQRAWILRYTKGHSYSSIQTYLSKLVFGGVSRKTVKRWDCLWKGVKGPLIQLLLSSMVKIHPTVLDFKNIKSLNEEQILLFLLPLAWEIFHPSAPNPSCGFFQWINQLMEKI